MPRQWPLLYLAAAAVFASLIRFPVSHGFRTDSWPCNQTFGCGRLTNLSFPFWPDIPMNSDADRYCDFPGFGLIGCDSGSYPSIYLGGYYFLVLRVNQLGSIGSMTVVQKELWDLKPADCQWNFPSEWKSDDPNLLRYSETNLNLSLFCNCPYNTVFNFPRKNVLACGGREALWFNNSDVKQPDGCDRSFNFTVNRNAYEALQNGSVDFWGALRIGFDLKFDFTGKCERDSDAGGTPKCKLRGSRSSHLKLIMGIAFGIAIAASLTFLFIYSLRKVAQNSDWEIEASIKRQANSIPKRFSFSEVKKITNSLKEKLGQGGYGIVYKGKLPNGRPVAVKVLKVSKGSGQDFVNEVVSISRTSHVNVVTLLGFCLEAKRRALIYEFMSNGSLDKFIYNGMRITLKGNLILGWDTLYRIAVGIAQGLEYLHNGCNTRIVHFDIKPHNILLDENFCPKISDFGLAKLCTGRESIVSLLDVRGTIGYIAPEVFSRTFGNISHKSDVYSYGMMVLEMAGGRKNRDVGISHTSEVYFPTWIYQQLELEGDLKLQGTVTSEELNIAKKMMIVGLWCIQTKPSDRPSISKVIEMLEGSLDVLQIPPKPYLSSPPRAQPNGTFSSTSL